MSAITVPTPPLQAQATSPTPAPLPHPLIATAVPLRRFTVDEYHKLIAQGYFAHDERFELLEGLIVHKMSRDPIHDAALEIAAEVLRTRVPPGWRVRGQCAITTRDSEPEPDLVIVRGTPAEYVQRHPGPADLALVVEVANTSLADDRAFKGRLYARAAIAVYWIINLGARRVEVYTDPLAAEADATYRRRQDYAIGELVPLIIDGTAVGPVPVAELLPTTIQAQQT